MKILCSDYDGTIKQNGIVRKEDVLAIENFMRLGNKFGIVTGRSISMIKNELIHFGINYDFIVGTNGGIVVDGSCERLFSADIDFDLAMSFCEELKQLDTAAFGITDGVDYATVMQNEQLMKKQKPKSQAILINAKEVELSAILSGGIVNSFFIKPSDEDGTDYLNKLIENHGSSIDFYMNNGTIDASAKGVSKKSGVDFIKGYFPGFELHVIGDGFNDLPMIKEFNGYSMTGAPQEVREHAHKLFEYISDCVVSIS